MGNPERIGNSNIVVRSGHSLGKGVSYNYDKQTNTYTITTERGTVIRAKTQAASNNSSIYYIEDDNSEFVALTNCAGVEVTASNSVKTMINLIGCNGCSLNVSENKKNDYVSIFDNEKFKSKNNKVQLASGDYLEIITTKGESASIHSKGTYSETTVKSEMNSWWTKIFGYSRE